MCSQKVVVETIDFPAFSYTSGITKVTVPLFNYYGMRKLRNKTTKVPACADSNMEIPKSKKVDPFAHKKIQTRHSSQTVISFFLGSTFFFRISTMIRMHRLGPCSFIPVGDSRHDALNRKLLLRCLSLHPKLISHLRPGLSVRLTFIAKMLYIFR